MDLKEELETRLMVEELIGSRVSITVGITLPRELTEVVKVSGRKSKKV